MCSDMPTATTCQYYQFTCADGTCIDEYLKCDDRLDCPDGSDELECDTGIPPCNSSRLDLLKVASVVCSLSVRNVL